MEWRDVGASITIQCRSPLKDNFILSVKKGINQNVDIVASNSDDNNIAQGYKERVQLNGGFPNLDILLKNLTSADTAPYWCIYSRFDQESTQLQTHRSTGSVLLVVTEKPDVESVKQCESSDKSLILVCVVISAAVLLGIFVGVFIFVIHKTKTLRTTETPMRVATNDVYEDMRGTLRH